MSDFSSDLPPEQHPAPRSEWKPISGLAVTSFALSLILILVALPGLWIVQLVPLALGAFTLMTVKPGQRRGRILAVWGIIVAMAVGSCSFVAHRGLRSMWGGTAESVLSVLSSKSSSEEKAKSLRNWTWPAALEKESSLVQTWMQRYEGVVAEFGPWTEALQLPSIFVGSWPMLMAPEGLVEVGTEGTRPPGWTTGSVIWAQAVFEKGSVHVALIVQDGDQKAVEAMSSLRPGEETAILGDVRFFRTKAP